MTQKINVPDDILPEGHPDPMLMSKDDVANAATDFATRGNKVAAGFLFGVLFARISTETADISLP